MFFNMDLAKLQERIFIADMTFIQETVKRTKRAQVSGIGRIGDLASGDLARTKQTDIIKNIFLAYFF